MGFAQVSSLRLISAIALENGSNQLQLQSTPIGLQMPVSEPRDPLNEPEGRHPANAIPRQA